MLALNPFLYGKPVPPTRFVGRQDAVRTIFSRLYNGESTAIVGEPHVGKSSLLYYVADETVRAQWLGEDTAKYFVAEMDCHMMSLQYTPAEFWQYALAEMPQAVPDEAVLRQWQVVKSSQFGSYTLKRLFELTASAHWRVVLVIDEFDVLLHHPNFKANAEFFGSLRSMAIHTDGLSVITASRMPVSAMNRLGQELNPFGSPFFNNFTEVRLLPLSPEECRVLIDTTLSRTGVAFTEDDYVFIHTLAGRHPFLVQTAAAGIYDAVVEGKTGEAHYEAASRLFHDRSAAHFDDFWRHLTPTEQTALVLLALGEIKARVEGGEFDGGDLGDMKWYGPELAHLLDAGMVEQVDRQGEADGLIKWQGMFWRVASRGFVWWVADNIIAGTRETFGFDTWLDDKEGRKLVTREQAEQFRGLVSAIPKGVVSSLGQTGEFLTASKPASLLRVRQLLLDHFDENELRSLCFDLKVDFESLPGEGKDAKGRELVAYMTRRERIRELEEAIYQLRPNIPRSSAL